MSLYIFLALAALTIYGQWVRLQEKRRLRNCHCQRVGPGSMGGLPEAEIRGLARKVEELGYRHFVDYTIPSHNTLLSRSYSSVFISDDRTVLASIEYYRSYHPLSFLASLMFRKKLWLRIGTVFISYTEDRTRILTSTMLAAIRWPDGNVVTIPKKGTSLMEEEAIHRSTLNTYLESRKVRVQPLRDVDSFFEVVRFYSERTAQAL